MKKYLYAFVLVLLFAAGVHTTFAATSPSTAATPAAAPVAATPSGSQPSSSNFVPLTALPGLSNFTNVTSSAPDFITFFNNLYKICIGLAAALAFVEIVWAGVTWMTAGDSSEQVSKSKNRIQNAVLGLVLVLSPVIVFGIIDPNILALKLDVTQLKPTNTGATGSGAGSAATGSGASGTAAGALNPDAAPGTAGAACSSNKDCNNDMVCNDGTGACAVDGPNVYSCEDDSAPNAQGQCANGHPPRNVNGDEAAADGSVAASGSCAGNEDACQNGYICNDQSFTCTAIPQGGSVGNGGSCAGNVNACQNGYTCDDDSDTCVAEAAGDETNAPQTVVCPDGTQVDDASNCADGSDGNDDGN